MKLTGPLPSYKRGFARCAGESQYPEMWRGLVGAWVPALGNTGKTLRDVSGNKLHTTNIGPGYPSFALAAGSVSPPFELALGFGGDNSVLQIADPVPAVLQVPYISIVATYEPAGYTATGLMGIIGCAYDYSGTQSGWGLGVYGAATSVAFPVKTALDSFNYAAQVMPSQGVTTVARYNGVTASMDTYDRNGFRPTLSQSLTLTHGGPITYANPSKLLIGGNYYGGTLTTKPLALWSILVYDHDIGPAMSRQLGSCMMEGSYLSPFVQFRRTLFPVLRATEATGTAESDLTLTGDTASVHQYRHLPTASSVISATVSASAVNHPLQQASSVITVTDLARLAARKLNATSALSLVQTSVGGKIRRITASSVASLISSITYVGPHLESAGSALSLTGMAHLCQPYFASASSVASLSGSSTAHGPICLAATSTLAFLSLADHRIYVRSATTDITLLDSVSSDYCHGAISALSLSDAAAYGQVFARANSPLDLVSIARSNPITIGPAPDSVVKLPATQINLSDSAKSSIHMMLAASQLAIVSTANVKGPLYVSAVSLTEAVEQSYDTTTYEVVASITGLQDAATVAHRIATPFANRHYIQLVDNAKVGHLKVNAKSASAASAIELDYDIRKAETGNAIACITLDYDVTVDKCVPSTSGLELDDIAVSVARRQIGGLSTLELLQSVTLTTNSDARFQYHPFGGLDPALPGPMAGITAPFQLVYPAEGSVTDSVTLRAPELGNKDRLSFNRVLRETRGGTLIVYADPMWPKIQTLVLNFVGLTKGEAQALLSFMENYLGQEVGMIDWEQRYWKGIITVPDPVIEDSFNRFSASFEFEGELDPTWSPQIIPVLPNTPLRRSIKSPYREIQNPMEPTPPIPMTDQTFSAESDDAVLVGQPLYIKASGHTGLACASGVASSAVGFAIADTQPTFSAEYVTEGKLTLTDWTAVAGTVALIPGAAYYLDGTVPGMITTIAPAIGYVVRVGRATSPLTLDIEIEPSVLL